MAVDQGKVVEVSIIPTGSEVTKDHLAGETVLYLDDTSDFDDDGGRLTIDGSMYFYKSRDDDEDTLTLAVPLESDVPDETEVLLFPYSEEKWATVVLEDGDDAISARIPMFLMRKIEDGVRDGDEQETCLVELEGTEWVIRDILGLDDSGSAVKFYQDEFKASVPPKPLELTYLPIDNSEHLYWGGLYQPQAVWTRSDRTVTITEDTYLKAGDLITVEYAYLVAGAAKTKLVTTQLIAASHMNTLRLVFIFPDGTRQEAYNMTSNMSQTPGPELEFGFFDINQMQMEFSDVSAGQTWTWPNQTHIRRDPISGTDPVRGSYTGFRYMFEDTGMDNDFNDIVMDVKSYDNS